MKLIHVYSDEGEYSASDFIEKYNVKEAYKKAKKSKDDVWEFSKGAFCKALDFAYVHVTEDFIDFVKSTIGDHEMMKHENFFVVEE